MASIRNSYEIRIIRCEETVRIINDLPDKRMTMNKLNTKLLRNSKVRDEIRRYKWIESEKTGADITWERAAREWLTRYADIWKETRGKSLSKR